MARKEQERPDFATWRDVRDDFQADLLRLRNAVSHWALADRLLPLTDEQLLDHISETGALMDDLRDLQKSMLVAISLRATSREILATFNAQRKA
jgi:hypothetical protein